MNQYIRIFLALSFSLLFTGCLNTYNLNPKYIKEEQSLLLDKYKIDNVKLLDSDINRRQGTKQGEGKDPIGGFGPYNIKKRLYTTDTEKISIRTMQAPARGIITNRYRDVLKKNKTYCNITEINNIDFMECITPESILIKNNEFVKSKNTKQYIVEEYHGNPTAYSNLKTIFLEKNIFDKLKQYITKKSNKDQIMNKELVINESYKNFKLPEHYFKDHVHSYRGKTTNAIPTSRLFNKDDKCNIVDNEISVQIFFYNDKFTAIYNSSRIKNKILYGYVKDGNKLLLPGYSDVRVPLDATISKDKTHIQGYFEDYDCKYSFNINKE